MLKKTNLVAIKQRNCNTVILAKHVMKNRKTEGRFVMLLGKMVVVTDGILGLQLKKTHLYANLHQFLVFFIDIFAIFNFDNHFISDLLCFQNFWKISTRKAQL